MRRTVHVLSVALAVAAGAFAWGAIERGQSIRTDAEGVAAPTVDRPPPELAAPSSAPAMIDPRPNLDDPSASDPLDPPEHRRREARARLVAVDATTDAPIDPQAPYVVRLLEGCEDLSPAPRPGAPDHDVAVRLPAGADATEIEVWVDGWGRRRFHRKVPLRVRNDGAVEEIRLALEPIDDADWRTARIVVAGDGDRVSYDDAIALSIQSRVMEYGRPHLDLEFEPGAPRALDVRVPCAADDLDVQSVPRIVSESGRRVWMGRRIVRVRLDGAGSAAPPTYVVVRQRAAILDLDLRYPPGERPNEFRLFWGQSRNAAEDGTSRFTIGTTYSEAILGAPDAARLEIEHRCLLRWVGGEVFGFATSLEPTEPLELRFGEVTHATVEFRREPPSK